MSDKDWINDGNGWFRKYASDGTWLIWNESWGGNKHTDHCHVSSPFVKCKYPNFKKSRLARKELQKELEK